jgi:hypothetical protein
MAHYAGIDVSLELSSVCVVDAQGKIVREAKVASDDRPPSESAFVNDGRDHRYCQPDWILTNHVRRFNKLRACNSSRSITSGIFRTFRIDGFFIH